MHYLNEEHIKKAGIDWNETIDVVDESVRCLAKNDCAQPIKPYLRYRDLKNRIIAMPAFVGGNFNMAGIKWIASFPDNIQKGIPRAHSIVILNNSETGKPVAIINTPLLSIIRTASVSGLVIKYFQEVRKLENINVGIIGWGPIGRYHYDMCNAILGNKISKIFLFDIKGIDKSTIDINYQNKTIITQNWEEAYLNADIFMTCTVSKSAYIDKKPKDRSLHINVSLRDYKVESFEYFRDTVIVDDWDEVCREGTDIELVHKEKGLAKDQTKSIIDLVEKKCINDYRDSSPVFFNPMGMGIFDIAIGTYYFKKALKNNCCEILKD
jgi:N-[(2S)-2-amino-2-carboxyethyl]-L-glutamate dehydrogenase